MIAFEYGGEKLELVTRLYNHGHGVCLLIQSVDGAPYAKLSSNPDGLIELAADEHLIKTYAENTGIAACVLGLGIFKDTGRRVKNGYVELQIWKEIKCL